MNYPFAAIVGQEKLKLALLLSAINPGIGGVLIRGEKGTAKSTAARALAEIVPPILKVADCPYNCAQGKLLAVCAACQQPDVQVVEAMSPFVNLPLGATEDRVIGSLDLEGVLAERKKKLQPGLLAAAHQGILYIDEVNLLPDHLVDVLLDIAAMGVNTIQREGLSVSHPARFTLIGTMNPEEGNLRPQFLDRFGIMVDVEAPGDIKERTEVVRRRIAFEADTDKFRAHYKTPQKALQQQLIAARQLLPSVIFPEGLLTLISQLCTELGVTSLRADIVLYKTALTLAAWAKRLEVTAEDVRQAAELALTHRKRKTPFSEDKLNGDKLDELMQQASSKPQNQPHDNPATQPEITSELAEETSPDTEQKQEEEEAIQKDSPAAEQVFGAAPAIASPQVETVPAKNFLLQAPPAGRRNKTMHTQRGHFVRAVPDTSPTDLAVEATVYQSLLRDPEQLTVSRQDLHQKVRSGKVGNLILFVVDASGSMAASRRMEAVKGAVLSLLTDAYQSRDEVGLIAFRGIEAQVLLPPTNSVELAEQAMRNLPTGGRTPLPHALQLTCQLLNKLNPKKDLQPLLVILSDGKANVALPGGGEPWSQTLQLASQLKEKNVSGLVLNTESSYVQLGRAAELAKALGAQYVSIQELTAETLTPLVAKVL
ncbi:putative cobaltochelatase [Pontibacter sp. 13R65]|uniref:putative cobaltochelatase n=1 Tax=Pontibacter sp. 13R65 TaxID=3127458 RepID=UPI00301D67FF